MGQRGEGEIDRALLAQFGLVVVADGRSVFDPASPVDGPGGDQQRLDQSGLARSGVADQDDVAHVLPVAGLVGRRHCAVCRPWGLVCHADRLQISRPEARRRRYRSGLNHVPCAATLADTFVPHKRMPDSAWLSAGASAAAVSMAPPADRTERVPGMLNRIARATVTRLFTPIARGLLRLGISADAVTIVGTLGVCVGALVFYPRGSFSSERW